MFKMLLKIWAAMVAAAVLFFSIPRLLNASNSLLNFLGVAIVVSVVVVVLGYLTKREAEKEQ